MRFDAYGRVEDALLFKGTDRYSGRRRNGANALDGCGAIAYKLDANRRVQELACLQWQGAPMLDTEGVARTRLVRDAAGFVVEELRFDLAGAPVANDSGVHKTLTERDADGRPTVERYRGVDDRPVASTQGCHGRRFERDARGAIARIVCLDGNDQPAAQPSGVSAEVYRVDGSGCRTGVRYLSLRGTPAAGHDLVHAMDYEVDDRWSVMALRVTRSRSSYNPEFPMSGIVYVRGGGPRNRSHDLRAGERDGGHSRTRRCVTYLATTMCG